jgi:hypothetical protein
MIEWILDFDSWIITLFLGVHASSSGLIMTSGNSSHSSWYLRIALSIWFVSAILIALMIRQLNGIVHGTLYAYGLHFSYDWATPYWSLERFIYVFLAVPATVSGVALVADFWQGRKRGLPQVKYVKSKTVTNEVKAPVVSDRDNSMLINCPKCNKVFSKPLSMLDFSSGKTRLVNVCPYCNHVLGDANNKNRVDIHVADTEQEEVAEER